MSCLLKPSLSTGTIDRMPDSMTAGTAAAAATILPVFFVAAIVVMARRVGRWTGAKGATKRGFAVADILTVLVESVGLVFVEMNLLFITNENGLKTGASVDWNLILILMLGFALLTAVGSISLKRIKP